MNDKHKSSYEEETATDSLFHLKKNLNFPRKNSYKFKQPNVRESSEVLNPDNRTLFQMSKAV